jgi:hypothetical protein
MSDLSGDIARAVTDRAADIARRVADGSAGFFDLSATEQKNTDQQGYGCSFGHMDKSPSSPRTLFVQYTIFRAVSKRPAEGSPREGVGQN